MNDLQLLIDAVKRQGADIAPTYSEYLQLALALATDCGEAGRSVFHALCSPSPKYRQADADKMYTRVLRDGRGLVHLGTVFHLAERAGVKLQNLQTCNLAAPPHPHTRAYTHESTGCPPAATPPGKDVPPLPPLPGFSPYLWPPFLQQVVDCGDSPAQRDILLLGATTVFGATLNRLMYFVYGRKNRYPCLQTFIVAPPASGKGALTWVRRLAEPIHDDLLDAYNRKMQEYRAEKARRDALGKEKAATPEPEPPRMKMFLITGDNSGTGMLENLMDADGAGLICETEADTVSSAIGNDYGHWSDTLRKSFDHERLAYNRRTNHEYRECKRSFLSVLLSGTPAQVQPLIPSAENGLFSRQVFYCMPPIDEWTDQFNLSDTDYDSTFSRWGQQWKQLLDNLSGNVSSIRLELSAAQIKAFNLRLARLFGRAGAAHGAPMKSTVARIAINLCRILGVVALLRALDTLLPVGKKDAVTRPCYDDITSLLSKCPGLSPDPDIPQENIHDGVVPKYRLTATDADFQAVLSLAEPLYFHACHVLSLLPAIETPRQPVRTTATFLDRLPDRFTRQVAIDEAQRCGLLLNTLDSLLTRMVDKGVLRRTQRGEYEFASRMRTHVCVGEAGLQDCKFVARQSVGF